MMDYVIDALIDTVKLVPYLFLTFLILEYIEHKISKKAQRTLIKYRSIGPAIGGIFGGFPQCGFSAMAANLYAARIITMGTLIAVFLSTSDEMLPIMLSENAPFYLIATVIGFKILVGVVVGFIIDIIFRQKAKNHNTIAGLCGDAHCGCDKNGVFISSLKHTLKTLAFVLAANLIINIVIYFIGTENLSLFLNDNNPLVYFVSSLIGLIPNCAGSIILTEAYLTGLITTGTALAGLLTGSGIGILLLFRLNKSQKENFIVLLVIYFVGVLVGVLVDLVL